MIRNFLTNRNVRRTRWIDPALSTRGGDQHGGAALSVLRTVGPRHRLSGDQLILSYPSRLIDLFPDPPTILRPVTGSFQGEIYTFESAGGLSAGCSSHPMVTRVC